MLSMASALEKTKKTRCGVFVEVVTTSTATNMSFSTTTLLNYAIHRKIKKSNDVSLFHYFSKFVLQSLDTNEYIKLLQQGPNIPFSTFLVTLDSINFYKVSTNKIP